MNVDEPTPRQLGQRRAKKTIEARSDRYAYVTLTLDRKTSKIEVEHQWLSPPEAYGLIVVAEQRYRERLVNEDDDE